MKAHSGITFTAEEMALIQGAMAHYVDALSKYRGWVSDEKGVALPGLDEGLKQMQLDINKARAIENRIYETCFQPKVEG